MDDADFAQLVNRALGPSTPRVWSLLVTMFGDLALAPDARLSGATVNAITAKIGIKPEATRVALHRLRKEDWIESHRTGRQTRYGLTPHGRSQTRAAWPRVYGPALEGLQAVLVVEDPSSPADWPTDHASAATVQIGPKTFVTTGTDVQKGHLCLPLKQDATLPDWVRDKLCPPEVQTSSVDLAQRLSGVLADDRLTGLSLLQRSALRIVIVHDWRRLILRTPAFPEDLLAPRWKGAECRDAIRALTTLLPVPDLKQLDADIDAG